GCDAALETLPADMEAVRKAALMKKAYILNKQTVSEEEAVHILYESWESLTIEDVLATPNSRELKKRTEGTKEETGDGLYVRGRSDHLCKAHYGRSSRFKSRGGTGKLKCFICHLEGHLKRDCPMKKSSRFVKKGKRDQDSNSSDDEGNAYFREALAVVGNDETTELIQLLDGSSFILEDVRYVSRLKRSLISLGTLKKEGYTVKMQMGRIMVIKGCRVMMTGIRKKNCVYTLEAKVMTFSVQKHGGSKQVGLKQLGSKQVGFKQLGHKQGAQEDREAEVFQVSKDNAIVAQRRLEDNLKKIQTRTACTMPGRQGGLWFEVPAQGKDAEYRLCLSVTPKIVNTVLELVTMVVSTRNTLPNSSNGSPLVLDDETKRFLAETIDGMVEGSIATMQRSMEEMANNITALSLQNQQMGNRGSQVHHSRLANIEFPKFSGDDVKGVFRCEEYEDALCSLLSRVEVSEDHPVSLFMEGLPTEIEIGVRLFKPKTLSDAYCLTNGMPEDENEEDGFLDEDETLVDNGLMDLQAPLILLNVLTRTTNFKTMRVTSTVGKHTIHILIDYGSTHSFLDKNMAKKIGCHIRNTCPLVVTVADGNNLVTTSECKKFKWLFGSTTFTSYVMLLPLGGSEMVLGIQWLATLGDIRFNFHELRMDFKYNGSCMQLEATSATPTHPML
ncbi:zinc finger, CCHC-type containing protein, partial [Tanacetum coccineum]